MSDTVELDSLVRDLTRVAGGYDQQLFADLIVGLHRTEQQNVMKLFLRCIENWAEDADKGYFDLRNEDTVKASKKIIEMIEKQNIRFPYI